MALIDARKAATMFDKVNVPVLGLIANIMMLASILYLYIIGNADAVHEAYICFAIAGGWALISALYVIMNSARNDRRCLRASINRRQPSRSSSGPVA